jgi:DNA polymerase IV
LLTKEQAPANEAEAEKERYFARLAALNDSSDDEIDANDGRQVLKKSKKVQYLQPIPNKSVPVPERQRMTATSKKVPKIHRTTSAPVSSGPKEKPPVVRKSSLRRVESLEHSIENVSSIPLDHHAGSERPTTSNQTMDLRPLVLINSTGIQSLLANKRKPTGLELVTKKQKKARKETVIEPVPLEQQFFAGKTFYFMPPDDVDPIRRNRITKVREFGAIWAKELISSTTHIVADKALTRKHVMNFLKLESLPQGIILVNEEYTFDCVARRFLLDHSHGRYALKGDQMLSEGVEEPGIARQTLEVPFEPKPVKSKFGDSEYFQMDQTPPRSQSSTQVSRSKGISESATIPAVPGINGSDESISPGDELDMIIQLALTKGLSLEEDEDDWETDGSAEDSEDSGTEDERPSSSDKGKKFGK